MSDVFLAIWTSDRYPGELDVMGAFRSEEKAKTHCEENFEETNFEEGEALEWVDSTTVFSNIAGLMAAVGKEGHYVVTGMNIEGRYF